MEQRRDISPDNTAIFNFENIFHAESKECTHDILFKPRHTLKAFFQFVKLLHRESLCIHTASN